MKLGTQVGDIVLDGDPFPPKSGGDSSPPLFGPCTVAKRLDGSRCPWYGGRPRPRPHCVGWDPAPPPRKKCGTAAPNFWPKSVVAKWLD